MEDAKIKCPKINQLSGGETSFLKTSIKDAQHGLRSSKNHHQMSPKIYTNNIVTGSHIPVPKVNSQSQKPTLSTSSTSSSPYSSTSASAVSASSSSSSSNNSSRKMAYTQDHDENEDESNEFRSFMAKRVTNTALTRHTSLLGQPAKQMSSSAVAKQLSHSKLKTLHTPKSSVINVPPPAAQVDCSQSLAFNYCDSASLRQRDQLKTSKEKDEEKSTTSGFKIYSSSQTNLKLSDSNDNSLVELDDCNESRSVRSPVSSE